MNIKKLRVDYEKGQTGLIYATSPDMKGLLASEPSIELLKKSIPQIVTSLYAADDTVVVVTWENDVLSVEIQ